MYVQAKHGKALLALIHAFMTLFVAVNGASPFCLLFLLVLPAYALLPAKDFKFNYPLKTLVWDLFTFFIGIRVTLLLSRQLESAVLASCLTLLLLQLIWIGIFRQKAKEAIIYAGTFAGMCSFHYSDSVFQSFFIAFLGVLLLKVLSETTNGFGGKLGTIGFGAVFIANAYLML